MASEDVVILRAKDAGELATVAREARADALFASRERDSVAARGAAIGIAATDVAGVERALALIEKVGLGRAAEELRAKQGVFVRVGPLAADEQVALMFSGQGSQYGGMMRALAEEVPAARAIVERADAWLALHRGEAISRVMFSGAAIPRDVFSIQASVLCADLMAHAAVEAAGVRARVITGHSYGDYAALVACGVWTLEDALLATRVRAEAITASTVPGGMTSISAAREDVERILFEARRGTAGHIQVANVNSQDQIVVAGTIDALERAERLCAGAGIETVRLDVPRAFHSTLMESARPRLEEGLARIAIGAPRVAYLSSVTGAIETEPAAIRRALVDQLVRPVEFVAQVRTLIARGVNVFVECGPKGVLAGLAKRILAKELAEGADLAIVTSDDAQRPGRFALARVAAALAARRAVTMHRAPGPVRISEPARSERARVAGADVPVPVPVPVAVPIDAALSVFTGDRARALLAEPGFAEFWSARREAIGREIRDRWQRERNSDDAQVSAQAPAPVPAAITEVATWSSEGPALAPIPELMSRHIIRAIASPAPRAERRFAPRSAVILGDSPRARAIAAELSSRGTTVHLEPDAARAISRIEAEAADCAGIVLDPTAPPCWSLDPHEWNARRARAIDDPFRFLRAWAPQNAGTLFAVTALGGGLGFENAIEGSGEHGGVIGLVKAIRREYSKLEVVAFDTSPTDPDAAIARALLAELDAGVPRLEVGHLRGKRLTLAMSARPASFAKDPAPLPRTWLLTGGARGVTARIAERLATLHRPTLHLLGKHALPPPAELARITALDAAGLEVEKKSLLATTQGAKEWRAKVEALEKSREIAQTLEKLRALGAETHYHAIDLKNRDALAALLRRIGPVEGLIHGAGVEIAKPFDKKSDDLLAETIAGKIEGLVNILALTVSQPLRAILGFSSVSGRFGGHGQTDYSLANEAMARILGEYRARSKHPNAVALSWPAFGEVGLAMRSSARLFLEKAGQSFMPPAEGANHLLRELWAALPEPEVTITDGTPGLDQDGLLPPRRAEPHRAKKALLENVASETAAALVFERTLDAREPFLDQHRMGATPILPAVIALELFAEAASLATASAGEGDVVLEDVEIHQPLKLAAGARRDVRVIVANDHLELAASIARPNGVVLDPHAKYGTAKFARKPSELRALADQTRRAAETTAIGDRLAYPYLPNFDPSPGARTIFHGPVFRVVQTVVAAKDGGTAELIIPAITALAEGTRAADYELPANLIDGCLQAAGMLGRLLYAKTALPKSFGRIFARKPTALREGERVELYVAFRKNAEILESDLAVFAPEGPILAIERYTASVLPEL